jgi:von Willebrand factor type A domain
MEPRKPLESRSTPWLAVVLSLAGHGMLILPALWLPSGPFSSSSSNHPCSVGDRDPVEFTLDEPGTPRPRKSAQNLKMCNDQPEPSPAVSVLVEESPRPKTHQSSPAGGDLKPTILGQTSVPLSNGGPSTNDTGGTKNGGQRSAGSGWLPPVNQAKSVVFLIDRSLSMGMGYGLSAAQNELVPVLKGLSPSTSFMVIAYNQEIEYLGCSGLTGFLQADYPTLHRVCRELLELQPRGGTNHVLGLKRALAQHPQTLVLLTDADDLTPKEIQEVTYTNGGRTAIHVVLFHWRMAPVSDTPLQQLADLNRGSYRQVVPQPQ